MYLIKKIIVVAGFICTFLSYSCPTCIGRLEKNSPVFFSDESDNKSIVKNAIISLQPSSTSPIDTATLQKKTINQEIEIESEKENHA